MNTTTIPGPTTSHARMNDQTSWIRRFIEVVSRAQTYRSIGYLLLGLPLGTIWFTVLVTGASIGISLLVVALLGVPVLWAMWYVSRACANIERGTANALLQQDLEFAPMTAAHRGNVWVRLRSMSGDRRRWREVAYLMLRFPAGIATFTAAITFLATPIAVAYSPIAARHGGNRPFGEWGQSSRIEDIASSPWAWLLIPVGVVLLVGSLHLLNALATTCGRWTKSWLA